MSLITHLLCGLRDRIDEPGAPVSRVATAVATASLATPDGNLSARQLQIAASCAMGDWLLIGVDLESERAAPECAGMSLERRLVVQFVPENMLPLVVHSGTGFDDLQLLARADFASKLPAAATGQPTTPWLDE